MALATLGTQLIRRLWPGPAWEERDGMPVRLALSMGERCSAAGDHRRKAIECLEGAVWISQGDDLEDYVLAAGDSFLISRPGRVVVLALADACVQILPAPLAPDGIRTRR